MRSKFYEESVIRRSSNTLFGLQVITRDLAFPYCIYSYEYYYVLVLASLSCIVHTTNSSFVTWVNSSYDLLNTSYDVAHYS